MTLVQLIQKVHVFDWFRYFENLTSMLFQFFFMKYPLNRKGRVFLKRKQSVCHLGDQCQYLMALAIFHPPPKSEPDLSKFIRKSLKIALFLIYVILFEGKNSPNSCSRQLRYSEKATNIDTNVLAFSQYLNFTWVTIAIIVMAESWLIFIF